MISFKINCPSCKNKVSISVKESDLGTRYRTTCPSCVSPLMLNLPRQVRMVESNVENAKKTKIIHSTNNSIEYKITSSKSSYTDPQEFQLNQPFLSFGRLGKDFKADLGLVTQDKSISRNHCIFRKYPNGITIEDISKGGTMLNNSLIKPNSEIFLNHGDIIRMGQTFFKFTVDEK